MITYQSLKKIAVLSIMWSVGAMAHAAQTDISTDPLNTYSAPSSSDVKPNVLFVLDDSGSMSWDFMPDWACASMSQVSPTCGSTGQDPLSPRYEYLFRNSAYNGIYYNPAVTYSPPVGITSAGVLDYTKYPNMTGTSTTTGGDSSASSVSPNWKSVKNDFTGVQSSGTTNVQSDYTKPPYFFVTVAGEYCDSPSFKNCTTSSAATGSYTYPAKLKWCNSSALTTCRAAFDDTYAYVRSPSPSLATITFSSVSSATVSSITVNGKEILTAWATSSTSSSTLASNVATLINQCTISAATNCTTYGFHAYSSGSVVTIIAPTAMTYTPVVTKTGVTVATTAFATNGVPGTVIPTVITPNINSYPYPGSSTKASSRTDCAGTTCTYNEEMKNYANWWTYYRTRMQMMKTAGSIAFASIDSATDLSNGVSRFRLGYMSINNNTTHDFLNLGEFAGTQKYDWYSKLLAASPGNSTPLRAALTKAGRLYGGKLNGTTFNGSTVTDPLQYSCQQNYTILSTDGFWNESSGYKKLDNSTDVGNQDGLLARPYYDGTGIQIQQKTSTLQSQSITYQPQISTSSLQKQITQLQKATSTLQKQTSQLQSSTSTLQKQTTQLQGRNSSLQKQTTQLQGRSSTLQKQTSQLRSSTSQLQTQTTQLQRRTSQLQKQISQLQSSTSSLQKQVTQIQSSTSSLQKQTTQIQSSTSALQKQTSQLQSSTSSLQKQTSQLQSSTSSLQKQTSQLQSSTSTLQSSTLQLQQATSTNSGSTWTAWANVSSCTWDTSGSTRTKCQYTGSWSAFANTASCTAHAQDTVTSNGTVWSTGTQCQYTSWTAWAGASSCTSVAQDTTSPYTVGTATQCRTVVTSAFANAASCAANSTPDGSGFTTQCQYTAWTAPVNVTSCTPAAQSSGPNYTVGTAVNCTYVVTSPFANAASCTATSTPNGSGQTTQCQYTAWTAPVNATSCTPAAQSSGPNYTVGTAVNCSTIVTSPFANAASCTATSTPNGSGQTTQCQYTAWTAPANASSCTPVAQSSGPSYTVATAVNCSTAISVPFTNASSCTVTSTPNASGQTFQCQYTAWTPPADATSCTPAAQSAGPTNYTVGTAVNCSTVISSPFANASSCTATSTPNSSGQTVQCQYTPWTAPANATSCTSVAQDTTNPYSVGTAVNCSYVVSTPFTNTASCTGTTTPDVNGQTTQCQYTPWTSWFGVASCTPLAQDLTNPYTVSLATECQSVVTSLFANTSSCTATATPDASGFTTQCQYTAWTPPANTASCTPAAQSSGPNYTVGTAVNCSTVVTSPFANAASCTATSTPNGSGQTTQCQYTAWTPWFGMSSCTPAAQSSGPGYTVGTATECQSVITAPFANAASCTANATPDSSGFTTQCQYTPWTSWLGMPSCTAAAQSSGPSYTVGTATQCQSVITAPYANVSSCTANATPDSSGFTTQCQYTAWTTPVDVTSCTAVAQDTTNPYSIGTAVSCPYRVLTPYANAATCTATTTPNSSGQTTQCQYTAWSSWVGVPSCTAVAQSTGPTNYTTQNAVKCQSAITSPYANASSCTVVTTPDASGNTTQCQYTGWSSWSNISSCTAIAQSTSPNYTVGTAQQCQTLTILGTWTPASTCTTSSSQNCQYTAWSSSWTNVSACTAVAQSTGPAYTVATARQCQTITSGGTTNTLADVAAYYYNTDLRSSTATGVDATGTCTGPIISPNTTANDLCADNVPSNGRDVATTQHMTTFTLGLGSQGQMIYAPTDGKDYWNDTSGDFYDVRNGTAANSSTGICSWASNGSACNWPTPSSNSNANIDDLWHAAVNGHGTYFSATDPTSLASSLTSTLATIVNTPRPGTAAAAASSNPNVSAADNYVFSSSYKSIQWYGELIRQQIDDTGTLTPENWSAMRLLDCTTTPWTASHTYSSGDVFRSGTQCYLVNNGYTSGATFDDSATGVDGSANTSVINVDENATVKTPVTAQSSRTIYTKGASGLVTFDWTNVQAEGYTSYFTAPAITYASSSVGLSQFCSSGGNCLASSLQSNTTIATGGAAGEALVNYLRGDRTYEGTYFRTRYHVLGDIVASEARYVQTPLFNYSDTNYSAFKSLVSTRSGTVYVGSNDGMVHAFRASDGQEIWGYIPSIVLPDLYKLADKNYSTKHEFLVDGTPETGDICPNAPSSTCTAAQWKTILVGGLNRGGKGYYALDITNPSSPQLLWEFTNANLGYAYSNPKIGKLNDGTWVVMIASGYNNADGVGRLFILNANTGALINTISTGVGTAASPSGLARISSHVMDPTEDNTIVAAYGGDVFGNLWRFDVSGTIGGNAAQLITTFKDASNVAQPITVKPLEATINGYPVVFVGTGIYLGTTDVSSTQQQTFYAVMDRLGNTTYTNPRSNSLFVNQSLTVGTCPAGTPSTICVPGQVVRLSSNQTVDWSTKRGWYIDLPSAGERSVTDPALGLGTLLFTTVTPSAATVAACGGNGTDTSASFLYALDYLTGGSVSGANNVAAISIGSGLATRPVMIEQSDGTVRALIRTSGGSTSGSGTDLGSTLVLTPPVNPPSSTTVKRVSWRELPTTN